MPSTVSSEKVNILGSRISVWDLEETIAKINSFCVSKTQAFICVSNVHTVVMGMQDPSYAAITNAATLATADGVPLVWASKVLDGIAIHGRASGPDILLKMLTDARCKDLKHYFYGSTPEVLEALLKGIAQIAPKARIVGFYSPPMRQTVAADAPLTNEEREECARIDASGADVVWVGLGAPKQEVWMYRMRAHLKPSVLIGVGAAFDFLSGKKSRAPVWMQKSGLEWFHRLMQEPSRLASRYLKTNPIFVAAVLKQAIAGKKDSKSV